MDDASRDLVVGAAKAVNPKVKFVIKFPNWYEHFQANGYDLDREPRIFDGIYTGTETRDPVFNDQHLQQYESYEILRYFDNVAPGRNGGGWVDTYHTFYLDRYAEQLWDTMLAKAPEIMLFQYSDLLGAARIGDRAAWDKLDTTFNMAELDQWSARGGAAGPPSYAAVAGYSLSKVDAVVGKLGNPIAIANYRPYQSTGEDFLPNYLGMIGIPIEMVPEFPIGTGTVLLTEDAKFDPQIVSKIKKHLLDGGTVVITSGLLRALQGNGPNQIGQIAEISTTGNELNADRYQGSFGNPGGALPHDILVPQISFMTNDAWPEVRLTANGNGAPLLIEDHYANGLFLVLDIPGNAFDLYDLPQPVLAALRRFLLRGFPVQFDAPSRSVSSPTTTTPLSRSPFSTTPRRSPSLSPARTVICATWSPEKCSPARRRLLPLQRRIAVLCRSRQPRSSTSPSNPTASKPSPRSSRPSANCLLQVPPVSRPGPPASDLCSLG